jgi:hypothetical protein
MPTAGHALPRITMFQTEHGDVQHGTVVLQASDQGQGDYCPSCTGSNTALSPLAPCMTLTVSAR